MAGHDPHGIRINDALRALRALVADPDDTAQVFRIIDALSGHNAERTLRRLRRTAAGRTLLGERPDVLSRLVDRPTLEKLPAGSLGREYLRFLDSEGITAEGLRQASIDGRREMSNDDDAELEFLRERLRDTHDLWHIVTGYKGDIIGEASLLAFSFAQTWNPGVGLIVLTALVRGNEPSVRRLIAGGFSRGVRAAWLPAVRWEELLHLPLESVRRRLNVGKPVAYVPFRTAAFRPPQAA
ncbi:MAG TPA: Coq4 family protein [Polyangiaceae bacterium]|jgi:ubiquinone biosynthesis protein COQ4|nr:Coq4 family protein [Polyangiaceae bacterium]